MNNDMPAKNKWAAPVWLIPALALVLAATAVWSTTALVKERRRAGALDHENMTLAANLDGVQTQVRTLSTQLEKFSSRLQAEKNQSTAQEAVPLATHSETVAAPPANTRRLATRRLQPKSKPAAAAVVDPRIDQVQARLSEHDKELSNTREQLTKTRQDLEGSLNSATNELNGSLGRTNDAVARTHEELVELQKRGQRNYYEFTLDKSKQFQRVGPISLSLRKSNTKRRSYDFEMMVDDQKLQKKNVNLFEPVEIMTPDRGYALQLVVNQLGKDAVQGYISEPKFKSPQVASTTTSPAEPTLQQRPQ